MHARAALISVFASFFVSSAEAQQSVPIIVDRWHTEFAMVTFPSVSIALDETQRAMLLEKVNKARNSWCSAEYLVLAYVSADPVDRKDVLPEIAAKRLRYVYELLRRNGVHDSFIFVVDRIIGAGQAASVEIEMKGYGACKGERDPFGLSGASVQKRPWK